MHRPLPPTEDLDRILAHVEARTLSKNLTFSYKNTTHQITTARPSYTLRAAHVEVRETLAGAISVLYKGQPLAFAACDKPTRQVEPTPGKLLDQAPAKTLPSPSPPPPSRRPPSSHPWHAHRFGSNDPEDKLHRHDISSGALRCHLYFGLTANF